MATSLLVCVVLSALLQPAQVVRPDPHCIGLPPPGTSSGVHTICVPETLDYESYRLARPAMMVPGASYPLIVLFHGSTGDHDEMVSAGSPWDSYGFVQAALDRDYIVMMHDGGRAPDPHAFATFGNDVFQAHTRAAIRAVLASFGPAIDRTRIYGYGFSMGAGELLSYSARHLDPSAPWGMFAATVNHTGALSLRMTANSDQPPGIGGVFTTILGADYLSDPFLYQRASAMDTLCFHTTADCTTFPCTVAGMNAESSLALNLRKQPMKTFFDRCEANKNITQSCELLDLFQAGSPFHQVEHLGDGVTPEGHSWAIVDPDKVLDVFDAHALDTDAGGFLGGDTLFAEDGRRTWSLSVERVDPGDFGRLRWFVSSTQDQVTVTMDSGFSLPSNVGALGIYVGEGSALRDDVCLEIILEADVPVTVYGNAAEPHLVMDGNCNRVDSTWTVDNELLLPPLGTAPATRIIKPFAASTCCP